MVCYRATAEAIMCPSGAVLDEICTYPRAPVECCDRCRKYVIYDTGSYLLHRVTSTAHTPYRQGTTKAAVLARCMITAAPIVKPKRSSTRAARKYISVIRVHPQSIQAGSFTDIMHMLQDGMRVEATSIPDIRYTSSIRSMSNSKMNTSY